MSSPLRHRSSRRAFALVLAACAVCALVLVACTPAAEVPQEPVWGKQPCAHCQMVVATPDSTGQALAADGRRVWFDDLGCLVAWSLDAKPAPRKQWVREFGKPQWLVAETARYEAGHETPMDFGFAARAAGAGVSWQDMTAAVQKKLAGREQHHAHP